MEYGVIGLLVLIFDIFAIMKVMGSSAPDSNKLLWVLLILFLPVLGLIGWWFAGPK